jgi:hypothetical protein
MEHPEDSLPPGLMWQAFSKAYSQRRRGTSTSERSAAWSRYKASASGTPKSPTRSPVRSVTNPYNLANLPADVVRTIASKKAGSAGVLAQLSRRTNVLSREEVLKHCSKPIGRLEVQRSIERNVQRRIREHLKVTGEESVIFTYLSVGDNSASKDTYELVLGKGAPLPSLLHYSMTMRVVTNSVRVVRSISEIVLDAEGESTTQQVADHVLERYDGDLEAGWMVLLGGETLRDVLGSRLGCPVDHIQEHAATRLREVLSSVSPLMAELVRKKRWDVEGEAEDVLEDQPDAVSLLSFAVLVTLSLWDRGPRSDDHENGSIRKLGMVEVEEELEAALSSLAPQLGIRIQGY